MEGHFGVWWQHACFPVTAHPSLPISECGNQANFFNIICSAWDNRQTDPTFAFQGALPCPCPGYGGGGFSTLSGRVFAPFPSLTGQASLMLPMPVGNF